VGSGFDATPQFAAAAEFLPADRSQTIGMSYFDLKGVGKAVEGNLPEEERVQVLSGLETLPVETVVGYVEVQDAPVLRYAAPFNPKSEEHRKLISALLKAKTPELFKSTPASSILFLSLDGILLQQIKQAALKDAPSALPESTTQQLAVLDNISSIGLGLANSSGASPFPEVFLLGSSTQSAAVAKTLREAAQQLTASSGMPGTPWQKKSIAGVDIDYMLSPLGIGIFVGSVGPVVFMASSESMVNTIISASSSKGQSLESTVKDLGATSLVASHLSFGRMHELLTSLQGTLAMFTGGQGFDATQYASLKQLGSISTLVSSDDKALRLVAKMRPEQLP
ncbi:MAG: hypothetical protein EBZ48_06310, partial [Proteobacteria bacterium]|nr:hypothetical protein [Pseudomonadota bacterium]